MTNDRIAEAIESARAEKRPLFIPFLTAGYPDASESIDLAVAAAAAGADLIELGLPFSDPLADGPTIQASSEAALRAGMTHARALEVVGAIRRHTAVPLVLMGCVNPILRFGLGTFPRAAREAGADALLVTDLPVEESADLESAGRDAGLGLVFLIAPTTPDDRIARLDAASTHFSYCISLTGVTGARDALDPGLSATLDRVARRTRKPFVVGFGISRPEQVASLVPPAAGVVVGSALIRAIDAAPDRAGRRRAAFDFVAGFTRRSREDETC